MDRQLIIESQALVAEVFRSFRAELLVYFGKVEYSYKSDHSQVTEFDIKIEKELKKALASKFPQLGFGGEETGEEGLGVRPYWLVDPIDGTSSFVRGIPNCMNMAALIVDNKPVAAVLYDFVGDTMYTALKGEGAYRDGERLWVSSRDVSACAMYINSFDLPESYQEVLRRELVGVFRPMGASGRAFCLVAEGKLDGYSLLSEVASSHDNAPGVLLATEAGAEIAVMSGHDWNIKTANFVVATPKLAALWRKIFSEV